MQLIDEQYVNTPCYGIDKMTKWLHRQGHRVNAKRIRRLMRQMGLEAIYPRPKQGLSLPNRQHKIYPYLLKNVPILRPDQVWSTDITYVRMYRGWLYLTAVMDWFSRYVLSWEVSITLESSVRTTRKSMATVFLVWFFRNVRHRWRLSALGLGLPIYLSTILSQVIILPCSKIHLTAKVGDLKDVGQMTPTTGLRCLAIV